MVDVVVLMRMYPKNYHHLYLNLNLFLYDYYDDDDDDDELDLICFVLKKMTDEEYPIKERNILRNEFPIT
jgi:hypothetical protein